VQVGIIELRSLRNKVFDDRDSKNILAHHPKILDPAVHFLLAIHTNLVIDFGKNVIIKVSLNIV